MISLDPAVREAILDASDQRDRDLALRLQARRDGWRACEQHLSGQYEAGYTDAQTDHKAIEHGIVRDLRQHLRTWDGLRENFGQPRPGDYPGREGAA